VFFTVFSSQSHLVLAPFSGLPYSLDQQQILLGAIRAQKGESIDGHDSTHEDSKAERRQGHQIWSPRAEVPQRRE